jgi:hypothetical protein
MALSNETLEIMLNDLKKNQQELKEDYTKKFEDL